MYVCIFIYLLMPVFYVYMSAQSTYVYVCKKCDELYLMRENPRLETGNWPA